MEKRSNRALLWAVLAVSVASFSGSYVVAEPLYNPLGAVVLPVLLAVLALSVRGVESKRGTAGSVLLDRAISRLTALFPWTLTAALIALALDIVITSYAVYLFGTVVEQNLAVRDLLRAGENLAWAGQQLSPAGIAGAVFGLSKSNALRGALSVYIVATLAYGVGTVVSDLLVVYTLGGFH